MKYAQYCNKVIVRIDKGEEIIETLKKICTTLNITLGTIAGIGATNKATIGLLNTKTKKYQTHELSGDHEIAHLYGNITQMNNEVYLHVHINLCNAENQSVGGHLTSALVSVTFEGVIDIIDGAIKRVHDSQIGVNLLDIS